MKQKEKDRRRRYTTDAADERLLSDVRTMLQLNGMEPSERELDAMIYRSGLRRIHGRLSKKISVSA